MYMMLREVDDATDSLCIMTEYNLSYISYSSYEGRNGK